MITCPKCGDHRLEEVMTNVTISSRIISVSPDECEYDNMENNGGDVDRYQCMNCGYRLKSNTVDELFEELKAMKSSR